MSHKLRNGLPKRTLSRDSLKGDHFSQDGKHVMCMEMGRIASPDSAQSNSARNGCAERTGNGYRQAALMCLLFGSINRR
jgi:hypothetical protein